MTIINLTNRDRWHLGPGYKHGWTKDFHSPQDRADMHRLIERGLIEPHGNREHIAAITPLGIQAMDYLESKKDEEAKLWAAILATVEDIKARKQEYSGTSRDVGNFFHHDDGITIDATCKYSSGNEDGSSTIFDITATLTADGQIVVKIDESIYHIDHFWGPGGVRDNDDLTKRVVVNGHHYLIGKETSDPYDFRGHSGRRFEIEFFDGRKVISTNLWFQGKIPPKWREKYPDNARFIPPPPRPSIAEQLGLKPVD